MKLLLHSQEGPELVIVELGVVSPGLVPRELEPWEGLPPTSRPGPEVRGVGPGWGALLTWVDPALASGL